MRAILQTGAEDERAAVVAAALYVHEGQDLEKYSYKTLENAEKMGATAQEKAKTALGAHLLALKALEYALENERKFKKILKKWDQKCVKLG